jgi:hypothetical protein
VAAGEAPHGGADDPAIGDPSGADSTHAELEAKLQADRDRRALKRERQRAKEERERAAREREAAEAARKEGETHRDTWAKAGKDRPILDILKEAGREPREVFEVMKAEALKAGTPEARIEALDKAWEAKFNALEETLTSERTQREEREKQIAEQQAAHAFASDFQRGMQDDKFAPLLEEYDAPILFQMARTLRDDPPRLFHWAKHLGVSLTHDDGGFTMTDILSVMTAQQAQHQTKREQRRNQQAAPQTPSPPGQQPASARTHTVNGTAARNAGTTIGNQLAAARAADATPPARETREQRLKRLSEKYPG